MNNYELYDALRGEVRVDQYLPILVSIGGTYFVHCQKGEINRQLSNRWDQLVVADDISEAVREHFLEIEEVEPLLTNTLTLLWQSVRISESALKKVILTINNGVQKADVGRWMKALIQDSVQFMGIRGDWVTTPQSLSKLVGGLIVNGNTLYDGTCGCGNLLAECMKSNHQTQVYGQEANPVAVAIAKLNLYVNGVENFDIRCGNTLSEPQHTDGINLMAFDNVVMNIPFSLKNWSQGVGDTDVYNRFKYGMPGKNNGDYAFILHALASLNSHGKAYIVVPGGVLFRGATEGRIRSELIEQDFVEGVIALPSNLLTYTAIPVYILILNKNKEEARKGKITFINAQDMGTKQGRQTQLSEKAIETIISAYNHQDEIKGLMKSVDISNLDNDDLSISRYFVKNEIIIQGQLYELDMDLFEKRGQYTHFSEVADFYRGINPQKACDAADATHHLVQLSDVQESQIIQENLMPVQMVGEHRVAGYAIKEGDVIISSRGRNIKLVLADKVDEGLILSNHFIGIRPKKGITGECIKTYLESPLGQFYLQQRMQGSTIAVLKEKDLYNMPFPQIERDQAMDISDAVNEANEQLQNALATAHMQYTRQLQNIYDIMGIKDIIKQ